MSAPRWTIITGASSGIGEAMARIAVRRGRALVLVARRTERLETLARELAPAGVPVEILTLDLEKPGAAEELISALDARGIVINTLVNNAGFGLRGRFATMPYAEQAAMVELNVTTLTRLCRLVLPGMVARGRGGIVNLSSVAAFQPIPFMAVYAATKAYVQALSEGLHEEVRMSGVTVTAVCPGPTATEFVIRADLEKSKMFSTGAMTAEAVAELAWAGHEARHAVVITGGRNQVLSLGARLFPRAWVRKIAGRMQG